MTGFPELVKIKMIPNKLNEGKQDIHIFAPQKIKQIIAPVATGAQEMITTDSP